MSSYNISKSVEDGMVEGPPAKSPKHVVHAEFIGADSPVASATETSLRTPRRGGTASHSGSTPGNNNMNRITLTRSGSRRSRGIDDENDSVFEDSSVSRLNSSRTAPYPGSRDRWASNVVSSSAIQRRPSTQQQQVSRQPSRNDTEENISPTGKPLTSSCSDRRNHSSPKGKYAFPEINHEETNNYERKSPIRSPTQQTSPESSRRSSLKSRRSERGEVGDQKRQRRLPPIAFEGLRHHSTPDPPPDDLQTQDNIQSPSDLPQSESFTFQEQEKQFDAKKVSFAEQRMTSPSVISKDYESQDDGVERKVESNENNPTITIPITGNTDDEKVEAIISMTNLKDTEPIEHNMRTSSKITPPVLQPEKSRSAIWKLTKALQRVGTKLHLYKEKDQIGKSTESKEGQSENADSVTIEKQEARNREEDEKNITPDDNICVKTPNDQSQDGDNLNNDYSPLMNKSSPTNIPRPESKESRISDGSHINPVFEDILQTERQNLFEQNEDINNKDIRESKISLNADEPFLLITESIPKFDVEKRELSANPLSRSTSINSFESYTEQHENTTIVVSCVSQHEPMAEDFDEVVRKEAQNAKVFRNDTRVW
ncbi:uncharacterized protein LOC144430647 [Styela clava]